MPSRLSQPVVFQNLASDTVQAYLLNNPWKFSNKNKAQRIFRDCLLCGFNRFSDEEWSCLWLETRLEQRPLICQDPICLVKLTVLIPFLPKHYYLAHRSEVKDYLKAKGDDLFLDVRAFNIVVCSKL